MGILPPTLENFASMALHGEQSIDFLGGDDLPSLSSNGGHIIAESTVLSAESKGKGGSLVQVETQLRCGESGRPVATLVSGSFVKGLQLSSPSTPKPPIRVSLARPTTPPVASVRFSVPKTTAFLYRIASGDYNTIHADPSSAEMLGLPLGKPILHGLCTLGIAARALVGTQLPLGCGENPRRLRRLRCRFVSPAYPGEDLETRLWPLSASADSPPDGKEAGLAGTTTILFRVVALPRGAVVIDFGVAVISKAANPVKSRL
jgi:acyl dehydratase